MRSKFEVKEFVGREQDFLRSLAIPNHFQEQMVDLKFERGVRLEDMSESVAAQIGLAMANGGIEFICKYRNLITGHEYDFLPEYHEKAGHFVKVLKFRLTYEKQLDEKIHALQLENTKLKEQLSRKETYDTFLRKDFSMATKKVAKTKKTKTTKRK